jgi:hypothetical protein
MFIIVDILEYCINNYSMIVGIQIPQYNTSFAVTLTSSTYTLSSGTVFTPGINTCAGPLNISTSETVTVTDTCSFGLLSIIYPAVPNAAVFENYALSEAVSYQNNFLFIYNQFYRIISAIELCNHVIMIHC